MNLPDLTAYMPYIILGLALVTIVLLALVIHLEVKVKRLLAGKDAKSLEDSIVAIDRGWKTEQKFKEEMQKYLLEVEKRLQKSIRGVGSVRFNAFAGTSSGANQSFATTYVDEKGNGIILSSLNSRERVSIFSKPIKNWKAETELSPEEKESLEVAKKSLVL